jgi:hypothetical protein
MRRDELCDRNLCEHPEGECPLDRLETSQMTAQGQLLRRAIDLRAALNLGIAVRLEDIDADEFQAMLLLEEERQKYEDERRPKG